MLLRVLFALLLSLAQVYAQSPVLPGFPPGVFQSRGALDAGGSVTPATLTYESISSIAANGATTNFGTMTYGSGCTRVIIAMVNYSAGSNQATAVIVNGISASAVSGAFLNGAVNLNGDIWITNSSVSGSSGVVSVTWTGTTAFGATAALYCLTTTTATRSDVQTINQLVSPPSVTLSVPTNGVGVALYTQEVNNPLTSWTGATQDATANAGGAALELYVAHTTATGSVPITANSSTNGGMLVAASWGP